MRAVDDVQHLDHSKQHQVQHRDSVVAGVATVAVASSSQEKSPVEVQARPLEATSGVLADLELTMAEHVQECRHTYKDEVLFGRRCQALSKVSRLRLTFVLI
jgi:hypothetical protein